MKVKRLFAILLALAMVLTYMPVLAFADTAPVGDSDPIASISGEVTENPTVVDEEESVKDIESSYNPELPVNVAAGAERGIPSIDTGKTDDELLEMFLKNHVSQEVSVAPDKGRRLSKAQTRRSRLNGVNLFVYDELAAQIREIAAGNRVNTEIVIDISSKIDDKITYTKEDLGLDSLFYGNEVSKDAGNAASEAFYEDIGFSPSAVVDALLVDMPYELYWFDKTNTGGYLYWPEGMLVWGAPDDSEACIGFDPSDPDSTPKIGFELKVSADYSSTGNVGTVEVDTAKTSAAAAFVDNTASIINDNKDGSDLDKLVTYKDEICDRTSYNDTAATVGCNYGNPWQMIWVFDGNEDTTVVCEGYAKAFQFLCDQSEFESDAIECYTVTGLMGYIDEDQTAHSEDHMWNILHMDDDKYYTADITNCDKGTEGYPDKLFLRGTVENGVPDGFDFGYDCDNERDGVADIWYQYDQSTIRTFDEDELLVSDADYEESSQGDDSWYDFEFAGDEDQPERLYSDGTIQYKLPEEAIIPEGADVDLRIGINTGEDNENELLPVKRTVKN